jgi:hypothetical protein
MVQSGTVVMQGTPERSTLTVAIVVNRRHDLKPDLDIAHELDKKMCGYMATKHDLPK